MDYSNIQRIWSTCSVEYFTAYYSQFSKFCLEELQQEERPSNRKFQFIHFLIHLIKKHLLMCLSDCFTGSVGIYLFVYFLAQL